MEESKKIVSVPEENTTVNFEVTEDKPFNKCFQCNSFRNGCSGPNLTVMEPLRACEFLQMTRVFLGYSYQYVADGTSLSLATVKRNLNGEISDPSFYTVSVLSRFLCGDPNGKYPCAIPNIAPSSEHAQMLNDAMRDLERALADNKDYRKALDNIHESYKAELQLVRDEAQAKIADLRSQLDRLQRNNDYLWAENNRKSKMVDMFLEKQNFVLEGSK